MASGHLPFVGPRSVPRLFAQELTDSEATRRVFLTVGGLLLLGLAMLIATVWWWRSTRPEHPALGPLEVMSERRWVKADGDSRRSLIDARRRPDADLDLLDPASVGGAAGAADAGSSVLGFAVVGSGSGGAGSSAARPSAELEPVDLSVLVRSDAFPLDDLAAIDRLLGLVPDDEASDAGAGPPVEADESVSPADAESADAQDGGAVAGSDVVGTNGREIDPVPEAEDPGAGDGESGAVVGFDASPADEVSEDAGVSEVADVAEVAEAPVASGVSEVGDVIDPLLQRASAKD